MNRISQFYSLLKYYVRNANATPAKCATLQTFIVSAEESTYSTEQLNVNYTEKDKPYFYSRKWENDNYPTGNITFEYPLLAIVPGNPTIQNLYLMDAVRGKTQNLEIGVFDKFIESGDTDPNSTECDKRNVQEIWENCELLLQNTLSAIQNYAVFQAVDGSKVYLPDTPGGHAGYIKLKPETSRFQYSLQSINNVPFVRWRGGLNNLYGVFATINLQIDMC